MIKKNITNIKTFYMISYHTNNIFQLKRNLDILKYTTCIFSTINYDTNYNYKRMSYMVKTMHFTLKKNIFLLLLIK